MSNFLPPFFQAFDTNGDPVPGAKMYTYQAGSTATNQATYSAATMAPGELNANPIVADANGVFGRIFCDPSLRYKFVLKTSAGVTLWTADYVDSAFLNSSSIAERIEQIASNPMDNGAKGDGVVDDSTAVQAAITNATGVVDLLGKTYRCDSSISLKSGVTIKNGTLDFSACTEQYCIVAAGTIGNGDSLASDAAANAYDVVLTSGAGFSTGDIVWIASEDGYPTPQGQLCQVSSMAGATMTLTECLYDAYTVVGTASAAKVSAKSNIVLQDLRIVASNAASSSLAVVYCYCTDRLAIRNCTISGFFASGVLVSRSRGFVMERSRLENGGASSAAIEVRGGCLDLSIDSSTVSGAAQGILVGVGSSTLHGFNRRIAVDGCVLSSCTTAAVYIDVMSQYTRVAGSVVTVADPAVGVYAADTDDLRVYGCTFVGGVYGVSLSSVTNFAPVANYFTGYTTAPINGTASAAFTVTGTAGQIGVDGTGEGTACGVKGTGGATNGIGVVGQGTGSGSGVGGVGGTTNGAGVEGLGGATNGTGVVGTGTGTGPGVCGLGAGTPVAGTPTTGTGVFGKGAQTNGHGGEFLAKGTGSGVCATGGASAGPGVQAIASNGAAVLASSTSGYGADLSGNATKAPLHLHPIAGSAPSSPAEGDLYADADDHKLYFYNGSTWVDLTA